MNFPKYGSSFSMICGFAGVVNSNVVSVVSLKILEC